MPTLIDAGAAEVFVTERDNLSGPFASEGVLGGDVADPPPADPEIVTKPAFAVVQAIADCFQRLGRDCPGAPPTAAPATATLPPAPPGQTSTRSVTIGNPGDVPIVLGAASVSGPYAAGLSVASNSCAGMVLEPRETCSVAARFAPAVSGNPAGALELSTDDGTLDVPLLATAPSLSGLLSADLPHPRFAPAGAGNGVGYPQRSRLLLANPFRAAVSIARVSLAGADARRFRVTADGCAHATLRPYGGCGLTVIFTPTRPGAARALLRLSGTGLPLTAQLGPVAFALPTVTSLATPRRHGCVALPGAPVSARISQPATVRWTLARSPATRPGACPRTSAPAGPVLASGTVRTRRRPHGDAAQWSLPGVAHLTPGGYMLTVSASNRHGAGPPRAMALRLGPQARNPR